jgi:hypothetical protein
MCNPVVPTSDINPVRLLFFVDVDVDVDAVKPLYY